MSLSPAKQKFVDCASEIYGEGAILDREMINNVCDINHLPSPSWFPRSTYSVGRGQFKLPVEGETVTPVKPLNLKTPVMNKVEDVEESVVAYHNPTENLIPEK